MTKHWMSERANASEPAPAERDAGAPASERAGGGAGTKPPASSLSRREFGSVAAAAAAGFLLTACGPRRLHDISKDRLRQAIKTWEREYTEKFGKAVTVSDAPPIPGVLFAFAL